MSEKLKAEFSEISADDLSLRLCQKADFYESADGGWRDVTAALFREADRRLSTLQREADGMRQSIGWVGEVYPDTNPESGGAIVHMTWDQFNAMREQVGLKPVKGRRPPQVEAEKGSDR